MKDQKKTEINLDEVIFEKRNKEYGANFLRKKYDKNVSLALTIAITLLLLVVAIPLIANYIHTERLIRETTTVGADLIGIDKPAEDIAPPPPPPPPPEVISQKVRFVAPKVVEDTSDQGVIFTQADLNDLGKNDKIDDSAITVDPDQNGKKVIDDFKDNTVYNITIVEEKPEYPGGYDNMQNYIIENVKYPETARIYKIQGTVFITFIVEVDGSLSNFKIEKGIGAGCDEEAERVIRKMPAWTPGKQNNKNVRVQVMVPIKFLVVQ